MRPLTGEPSSPLARTTDQPPARMATHSSSESWSGAGGADVIDLDRFMRGVRPHRPTQRTDRNHLVVDNGGLTRKPPASSSSSGASTPRAADPGRAHNKHYSHDSGVSDGSYVRRRHRPHRRYSVAESAGIKTKREGVAARASGSTGSMRAFRAACERTLRDQQRQLARVALLCERLGERQERSDTERTERATKTDSSDLSSSSRSTRDPRRKDKNRAQECKTYKIIMSKLDELNRVFLSRRSPAASPARRRPPPSASVSVSVSDKLVATDEPSKRGTLVAPTQKVLTTKRVETEARQLVERAVGESPAERTERADRTERAERFERDELRSARLANLRAVNNAYALDIAPRKYPNIATESVVQRESSEGSLCDARSPFNLDDPVQLYAQAKRLQAMHVTSARRTRSSERAGAGARKTAAGAWLCALCREYWRALRGYLAVCCPRDDLPCACS